MYSICFDWFVFCCNVWWHHQFKVLNGLKTGYHRWSKNRLTQFNDQPLKLQRLNVSVPVMYLWSPPLQREVQSWLQKYQNLHCNWISLQWRNYEKCGKYNLVRLSENCERRIRCPKAPIQSTNPRRKFSDSVGDGRRACEPRIDDNGQLAVYLGHKPGDDNAAWIYSDGSFSNDVRGEKFGFSAKSMEVGDIPNVF